jgi:hypothetical protein
MTAEEYLGVAYMFKLCSVRSLLVDQWRIILHNTILDQGSQLLAVSWSFAKEKL